VLFGLAPAWHATKLDLVPMLKDDRRGGSGKTARFSFRNLLVIAQVAVSLILLICAGLFTRSLQNIHGVDPGFETERVLTVPLDLGAAGYDETRGRLFYQQLLDQFEQTPGVQQASLAEMIPLKTEMARSSRVAVEGYDAPDGDYPSLLLNTVGPRYFETMGIPLVAGREFNHQASEGAPLVAIINETMARRFWTAPQSALGRRLRLSERDHVLSPNYEVVGVVKDSKYRSMSEAPRPFFYVSALQHYRQQMALSLRTIGEPSLLRSVARDRVLALDKGLLVEVATMRENLAAAFLLPRVAATVLGLIGLFGMSLAVVGIYGVISYAVSQRTGEIGLRMALGAESRDILRLVIGQGLKLTLIGVGLGAVVALALSRLLSRLLIGVSAADPLTFLAVPLLLTTVALFACWIPARRAAKVDPMIAPARIATKGAKI
jgi:predicted permease